jgi:hypothetical protein
MSKNTNTVVEEKDYLWKEDQEEILKKWADKGTCFKMMHERAYKKYWCMNAWFNIPVIIISTITGTGNFASNNFGAYAQMFTFIIGGFNIFAGMLATISTYIGAAQKLEGHRFSSIQWDKFTRKVQIELAKTRNDRIKAKVFIKQCAEEYDRLIEMSPILPNDIINWFKDVIDNKDNDNDSFCYECVCFPCGCAKINICGSKDVHSGVDSEWDKIELPEIIGRVKATHIASEPVVIVEPPVEVPIHVEEDTYNIYGRNNV